MCRSIRETTKPTKLRKIPIERVLVCWKITMNLLAVDLTVCLSPKNPNQTYKSLGVIEASSINANALFSCWISRLRYLLVTAVASYHRCVCLLTTFRNWNCARSGGEKNSLAGGENHEKISSIFIRWLIKMNRYVRETIQNAEPLQ